MGFKGRSVGGEPLLEEDWSLEGDEEYFEDMVGRSGNDQLLGIWKCIIVVSGKRVTGLYIEFSGHPVFMEMTSLKTWFVIFLVFTSQYRRESTSQLCSENKVTGDT